jgi:T4 bacteriophage base plate protein
MALPKIEHPIFTIQIPSSKKNIKFRPFLVKEEKILLIAKESNKENDMMLAIKQIVNNCCLEDLDIDKLPIFDLEFLFLQLRAQSVNNTVNVSYRDLEDEQFYDFTIDLFKVDVKFPDVSNKIEINDKVGIIMKYPEAALFEDKAFIDSGDDAFYQLILRCVDKLYDEDNVYDVKNYTLEDLEEYIYNLDIKTFEKIRDFMMNQPRVYYAIEYKNSNKNSRKIELTSLTDFFTLR